MHPAPLYTPSAQALTPQEALLVETLQHLEPQVRAASQLALARQATIVPEKKLDTGNPMVDVVTAADREVQRHLLQAMRNTPLEQCRLLAEESGDDDLQTHFDHSSHLVLSIDPIDGTRRYTENKPWFSTIIGLHNGLRPLYSFVNYPALGWWIRLAGTSITTADQPLPPMLAQSLGQSLAKTVVYTAGRPLEEVPGWVTALEQQGISFAYGESVAECGSKMLVLSGTAGGYYCARPNAYDGLFGLHYGMARGSSILAWGGASVEEGLELDLGTTQASPSGTCYAGGYLVLPLGTTVPPPL
jgi:fructose-1,6-bisphosphatase/inositol monophosphatase family enzyme